MSDAWTSLEEATRALSATADRAASLIRQEAERSRAEAARTRGEIDSVRNELLSTRCELQQVRGSIVVDRDETDRTRRAAKIAWSAVGAMGLAIVIAVGWTAVALTHSSTRLNASNEQLSQWRTVAEQRDSQIAELRNSLQIARTEQARVEGEMQAMEVIFDYPSASPQAAQVSTESTVEAPDPSSLEFELLGEPATPPAPLADIAPEAQFQLATSSAESK